MTEHYTIFYAMFLIIFLYLKANKMLFKGVVIDLRNNLYCFNSSCCNLLL